MKTQRWAGRMAQWLKALAAKPGGLSSSFRTHMVEVENQLPQVVLGPLYVHRSTQTHLINK